MRTARRRNVNPDVIAVFPDEFDRAVDKLQKQVNGSITQLQFYDRLVQHLKHIQDYLSGAAGELASRSTEDAAGRGSLERVARTPAHPPDLRSAAPVAGCHVAAAGRRRCRFRAGPRRVCRTGQRGAVLMGRVLSAVDESANRPREFQFRDEDFNALRTLVRQRDRHQPVRGEARAGVWTAGAAPAGAGGETFSAYRDLLAEDADGPEMVEFINAITTNLTSFFRESHHFEYLREQVLPPMSQARPGQRACGSGRPAARPARSPIRLP